MGKPHEIVVNLRRDSPGISWGFSLVGGADVKTPLIVTRVGFGSPADGVLQRGDIISKIGNYDSRDIRHQDAQNLFRNAGNNMRVVVQRESGPGRQNPSTGSSLASSYNHSPLSVSPHLSPKSNAYSSSPYSPVQQGGYVLTPIHSPLTPIDDNYFEVIDFAPANSRRDSGAEDVHVTQQPYRTTPLVLPGAKVKHEYGRCESYLRHHPNPAVRARPHHTIGDNYYKQKVANSVLERVSAGDPNRQLVHKQFNSPINLYSQANIEDTIRRQTIGGVPQIRRIPVKYNPAESETYRAIQEEQMGESVHEVRVPPQSKVYVPNRTIPVKRAALEVNQNPASEQQNGAKDDENIQQSGSFKRIMWSVLSESDY